MKEFKIEKGIPFKRKHKNTGVRYPFEQLLEVGDSFLVPFIKGKDRSVHQSQILAAGRSYTKTHKLNWQLTSAKQADGIRIWRKK